MSKKNMFFIVVVGVFFHTYAVQLVACIGNYEYEDEDEYYGGDVWCLYSCRGMPLV